MDSGSFERKQRAARPWRRRLLRFVSMRKARLARCSSVCAAEPAKRWRRRLLLLLLVVLLPESTSAAKGEGHLAELARGQSTARWATVSFAYYGRAKIER
jgi:hypothetical protein